MLIDCGTCETRGSGCAGCFVAALYEPPAEVEMLDRDELWAIEILTRAGFDVALIEQQPESRPLRLAGRRGRAA
jgi:hypothetical protein